jgi:hypothetical protein
MIGYGTPDSRPPEVHVGAAHLGARRAQQRPTKRMVWSAELSDFDWLEGGLASLRPGCGHPRWYVTL